jgi:pyruvate,water dikinase
MAVRACWASAFEPDAVYYRAHQGHLHNALSLPILVQRMVQADVSGTVLTAEPILDDPTQLVVEAIWGLGQAVCEATVTPDLYLLDRQTLEVVECRPEPQEWKLQRDPAPLDQLHGSHREPLLREEWERPKLAPEDLRELASLALWVEARFGAPEEIAWAREQGRLWVLGARPLTSLTLPRPGRPGESAGAATRSRSAGFQPASAIRTPR